MSTFRIRSAHGDSHRRIWARPAYLAGVLIVAATCLQTTACNKKVALPHAEKRAEAEFRNPGALAPKAEEPGGAFNTEQYNIITENEFKLAASEPLSTFSIDVDTASYSNVRRFLLDENTLPPKDAVRIEEMVNYFDYHYPQPKRNADNGDHPVAIATEVASCPWDERLKLVRIGLQARIVPPEDLPPRNFVFLLDTSGSMNAPNKLPLLKHSLELMIEQMRPEDRIAIVAYAGSAGLVLDSTPGTDKQSIRNALHRLEAGGSTNAGDGIKLAYNVALRNFVEQGVNRVIIGTDGDFNVGVTGSALTRLVEEKRKSGIYLSMIGLGTGNLKDGHMEELAHHGNGHYAYIDTLAEAHKIFVEQGGAMYTLANDVKVQVEFNPARVQAWRLVGYENRLLQHQDFNDDKKDAGDLGSGHAVTAFYVVAPPGVQLDMPTIDKLKFQKQPTLTREAEGNDLLFVKIRYKNPGETKSTLIVHAVQDSKLEFAAASSDFRFAASVAEFGLLLRDSRYKGSASYQNVLELADATVGPDRHRREFIQLVRAAQRLARPDNR